MTVKAIVRSLVERTTGIDRVYDSPVYGIYERLRFPHAAHRKYAERAFYGALLAGGKGGAVFDVGANKGAKTRVFLDVGMRVVSF